MRKPQWLPMVPFRALVLVGAVTVLGLSVVAFITIKAQHTLNRAIETVASQGDFAFEIRDLRPNPNLGFEAIAPSATYTSGAWYDGHFYLSGPAGLSVFAGDGQSLKTYRAGLDLPPVQLGQVVVGKLRGTIESQLLIATSGEGMLIFFSHHRPDGSGTFRQMLPRDKDARDITALLPLPGGELLIGTRHRGLLVYRGSATGGSSANFHQLTLFNPQYAQLSITALAADSGGFWAGTQDRGVLHWHAGQTDSFQSDGMLSSNVRRASFSLAGQPIPAGNSESSLPDNQVLAIAVNGNKAYVGTPTGVEEFTSGTPARELAPGLFANTLIANGTELVVGSIDQGIQTIPLGSTRLHNASRIEFSDGYDSSARDIALQFLSAENDTTPRDYPKGRALFAVMRDGLYQRESNGRWTPLLRTAFGSYTQNATLTDRNISALAFDPDGRLWVGYFDRGLDVLAARSTLDQRQVSHLEDDHLFCINRIVLDPRRNTMAVATANGLTLFDAQAKPRQTLTRKDGLIADHINDVLFRSNQMVVATPAGLTFVDQSGARSLYAFEGLVNNHVYALAAQPGKSTILAGTLGGISMLEGEEVKRNLTANNSSLKHNWITAILPMVRATDQYGMQTQEGSWMVGTYGAGIMQLGGDGAFAPMQDATRDMIINPNAMFETNAHIFAGSLGQGLWVRSRSTARWTQITAGLPSENVTAIAEHEGQVYIGTDSGLVRISERLLP